MTRERASTPTPMPSPNDWPRWVAAVSSAIAVFAVGLSILQRQSTYGSIGRPLIYAAIAVSPFVLDAVDVFTPFRVALPLWAFPIPVLVGGALLVANPAQVDFAPFIFVFLCGEFASRSADRPWMSIAVALASIGIMIGVDVWGRYDASLVWVIGISFGWFGGTLIQNLSRNAAELRAAQAGLTEKAATDERQRIAREIHDVIAHSMSVTMLHVTAARMALERDRSADALDALREAEAQGRKSLSDIRHTVGLLGDASGTAPPMPSVSDIEELVSDYRAAGLDVALSMDGELASLPPTTGLSIYRIVQESLTNVAKHAPGVPAEVALRVWDSEITVRIHNRTGNGTHSNAADGGGMGVRGMVERAMVLQGSLEAGPEGDGWTVYLVAPRPAS